MQLQFKREFVNDIYLFCDNNVTIIKKERRVKKSFKVFVKHISLLSLIVILKKIILLSHLKNLFKCFINYSHYSFL